MARTYTVQMSGEPDRVYNGFDKELIPAPKFLGVVTFEGEFELLALDSPAAVEEVSRMFRDDGFEGVIVTVYERSG